MPSIAICRRYTAERHPWSPPGRPTKSVRVRVGVGDGVGNGLLGSNKPATPTDAHATPRCDIPRHASYLFVGVHATAYIVGEGPTTRHPVTEKDDQGEHLNERAVRVPTIRMRARARARASARVSLRDRVLNSTTPSDSRGTDPILKSLK